MNKSLAYLSLLGLAASGTMLWFEHPQAIWVGCAGLLLGALWVYLSLRARSKQLNETEGFADAPYRNQPIPKSLFIFPILALGTVAGGIWLHDKGLGKDPEVLLQHARTALDAGEYDADEIRYELDLALRLMPEPRERDGVLDATLAVAIYRARADFWLDQSALDRAREEYNAIAALIPDDVTNDIQLAKLDGREEKYSSAIARLDSVMERSKGHVGAHLNRARMRMSVADQILAEADDILAAVLDDEQAAIGKEIAAQVIALDRDDPIRAGMLHRLTELFPPEFEGSRKQINNCMQRASVMLSEARTDFLETLRRGPSFGNLSGLIELYHRSGRAEETIDFGLSMAGHLAAENDKQTIQSLADALGQVGRSRDAALLVAGLSEAKLEFNLDFMPKWCEILYQAEFWPALTATAGDMREQAGDGHPLHEEYRSISLFYQGIARNRMGSHATAASNLRTYTLDPVYWEPVHNARLLAFQALADSTAALRGAGAVRQSLQARKQALILGGKADAAAWEELIRVEARLQSRDEELLVSHGHWMASAPERSDELFKRWSEFGERVQARTKTNITQLHRILRRDDRWVPVYNEDTDIYLLWKLAELHLQEEDHWAGAAVALELLLDKLPFFPPALDLYLRACQQLGRQSEAIDLLLDRLNYLSDHRPTVEYLMRLEPEMTPAQRMRLVRLTPTSYGLHAVARALLQSGRYEEARRGLQAVERSQLLPEGLLLLGETYYAQERYAEAIEVLEPIRPQSEFYGRAFQLLLESSLRSEDQATLLSTLDSLRTPEEPMGKLLLPAVDRLLLSNRRALARSVCEYLDAQTQTRSGRAMITLAILDLWDRKSQSGMENLLRAEAFLDDGGPALGRIIQATQEGRWNDLPRAIHELKSTGYTPTPVQQVVLALYEERVDLVASMLGASVPGPEAEAMHSLLAEASKLILGTEVVPSDAEGVDEQVLLFLQGQPEEPRDPRYSLAWILAIEHAQWRPWALGCMRDLSREGEALWPLYLETELLLREGAIEMADERAVQLTQKWGSFQPVWELARRISSNLPAEESSLRKVARKGRRVAASPETRKAQAQLDWARDLIERGNNEKALQKIEEALAHDPIFGPALYEKARLLRQVGQHMEALKAYNRFFATLIPKAREAFIPEILDLFAEAHSQRSITRSQLGELYQSLTEDFPNHALVVIAAAQFQVTANLLRNPVESIETSYAELAAFRERTEHAPIGSLYPGALERWFQFYLHLDPVRGEQLMRSELEADPTAIDPWLMLVQAIRAQGRVREAARELDALIELTPDERAVAMRLGLSIDEKQPIEKIRSDLTWLEELRSLSEYDLQMQFLFARAMISTGVPANLNQGLEKLQELWEQRSTFDSEQLTTIEVGRTLGVMLLRSGKEGAGEEAGKIFIELAKLTTGTFEHEFYRALALLSPYPALVAPKSAGGRPKEGRGERGAGREEGRSRSKDGEAEPSERKGKREGKRGEKGKQREGEPPPGWTSRMKNKQADSGDGEGLEASPEEDARPDETRRGGKRADRQRGDKGKQREGNPPEGWTRRAKDKENSPTDDAEGLTGSEDEPGNKRANKKKADKGKQREGSPPEGWVKRKKGDKKKPADEDDAAADEASSDDEPAEASEATAVQGATEDD